MVQRFGFLRMYIKDLQDILRAVPQGLHNRTLDRCEMKRNGQGGLISSHDSVTRIPSHGSIRFIGPAPEGLGLEEKVDAIKVQISLNDHARRTHEQVGDTNKP